MTAGARVALVTGASRGIGAAVAERLAAGGDAVALAARSATDLDAVAARIEAAGGTCLPCPLDVRDAVAVERAVGRVEAALGPVEVLVSNAAVLAPVAPVGEPDPVDWAQPLLVNVLGAWHVLRAVLPGMLARDRGWVVAVSSSASQLAFPRLSAYCASKAAFEQLHRVAAAECEGTGVRINAVWPGAVDTDMQARLLPPVARDARPAWLRAPEAIAPHVVALCATSVSVHGARIDLDEILATPGDEQSRCLPRPGELV